MQVHAKSTKQHKWLVVVDAAAYVPTHPLDLSKVHPDFVPVSWYKLFGFPTGMEEEGPPGGGGAGIFRQPGGGTCRS